MFFLYFLRNKVPSRGGGSDAITHRPGHTCAAGYRWNAAGLAATFAAVRPVTDELVAPVGELCEAAPYRRKSGNRTTRTSNGLNQIL